MKIENPTLYIATRLLYWAFFSIFAILKYHGDDLDSTAGESGV